MLGEDTMETIKFVQSYSSPFLDLLFQSVTMMGEEFFLFTVITLIFWCINKELGYRVGLIYISGSVLNFALKEIFHISRPMGETGIRSLRTETAVGYSFPSGHTQNAVSFWLTIILKARKKWIYTVGTVAICLVALSRIYLGVHTPLDVLGGLIIGGAWVLASNSIFDFARKTGRDEIFLVYALPMLTGMFFFNSEYYFRASGALTGFLAGYLAENRYIRYEVSAPLWVQLIKMACGLAVLLAIKTYVRPLLPDSEAGHFIRYFLMGIWVTLLAPCLFKLFLSQLQQPGVTRKKS